jgi:ubiquinone/menaquinone biosynthesis C-methylase UbiE
MFSKSAAFYDALYSFKDHAREAAQLRDIIAQHKQTDGATLLDVACGTGQHIAFLRDDFVIEGLDLDAELLAIAQQKHPDLVFHQADMLDFELGKQFDVVTCLFSSIGYVQTLPKLHTALQTMSKHTKPGGVLVVEPWFSRAQFIPGHVAGLFIDQPDLKIARMNVGRLEDELSIIDFHYLVATPAGVEHFTERHALGLFDQADYMAAFEASGLRVTYDEQGLMGRGLYVGVKQ